jgi:hypothetical protein
MTDEPTSIETTVEALAIDLAEIAAERAILATLYRYGHSIDYGLTDDWLDCFTADGAFDVRRRTGPVPSHRHEGREALEAFIAQHTHAPAHWHKHLLAEPVITVVHHTASARSYFTRLDARDDGTPFIHAFGRYVDELAKGSDGVWRFTQRIAEVESFGG